MIESTITELEKTFGASRFRSKLYETEPWGIHNQPLFLNCCLAFEINMNPQKALKACQTIEQKLGKFKKEKLGPRNIDIDLLFYGNTVLNNMSLTLPHPEISDRQFVLIPMMEIAADFQHPVLKKSMRELLKECRDNSIVRAL